MTTEAKCSKSKERREVIGGKKKQKKKRGNLQERYLFNFLIQILNEHQTKPCLYRLETREYRKKCPDGVEGEKQSETDFCFFDV